MLWYHTFLYLLNVPEDGRLTATIGALY